MRTNGTVASILLLLFAMLLVPASSLAEKDTPQPGRLPNSFSGYSIVASAIGLAHDRSRASAFVEVQQNTFNAINKLRTILTTPELIKAFAEKLQKAGRGPKGTNTPPPLPIPFIDLDLILIQPLIDVINNYFNRDLARLLEPGLSLTFDNDVAPLLKKAADTYQPQLFGIEWNYRQISARALNPQDTSHTIVFNTPRFIYSDARGTPDFIVQALSGGIGISTRIDLAPFRFKTLNDKPQSGNATDATEDVDKAAAFVRWLLLPKMALLGGYRNVPSAGYVWDSGLSFSYLRPLGHRPSGGVLFQVALQPYWFNLQTGNPASPFESRSFVSASAGIAWQDDTPLVELIQPPNSNNSAIKEVHIRRWHWRIGFDYGYVPRYPLGDGFGSTWSVAVRHRDRGSGEYTLTYGKTAFNEDFFGVSIGTYLRL